MTESRYNASFSSLPTTSASRQQDQHLRDHVARQSRKLIHLLESINCPQDLYSLDRLEDALLTHYQQENEKLRSETTGRHYSQQLIERQKQPLPSTSQFLDWLVQNVDAETNWPDFKDHVSLWDPRGESTTGDEDDKEGEDDEESMFMAEMQSLDQEHLQLQNTLASMEREMADLRALQSHARDQDRILDMDLHDTSIQFDAMLQTLEEAAQKSATELLSGTTKTRPYYATPQQETNRESDKGYLYLQQEALQELQQMDKAFLEQMESYYIQIMNSVLFRNSSSAASSSSPTNDESTTLSSLSLTNRFDRLLKRNPVEDKELVRLCSIYRATKMSHIRATAQLKCLEQELDYMKSLSTHQQAEDAQEEAAADQDLTTEYVVSVAQSKMRIQRSKQQQELEMISVQREVSRLEGELEQVLSDPDPVTAAASTKRDPRLELMMDDIQGATGHDDGEVAASRSSDERRGVLVDVCERIARNDLELRFISAAHRDYIETQNKALAALDQSLDRLLEYYCFGVLIEQVLEKERGAMKTQKDLLWAAIQECQDHQRQSSKLRTELSRVESGSLLSSSSSSPSSGSSIKNKLASSQQRESDEFLGLVKRLMDMQSKISEERWTMVHKHVGEISSVAESLNQNLLNQHSNTEEVQLVPRDLHEAKRSLEERTRKLRQEYVTMNDHVEKLLGSQ